MLARIVAILGLGLTSCANPVVVDGWNPDRAKSEVCIHLLQDQEYDSAVDEYSTQWQLSEDWNDWMKENRRRFCEPFYKTQELEKKITIAIDISQDPSNVYNDPSWVGSSEHLNALGKMISLAYPTWEINLVPIIDLDEEDKKKIKTESDVTLFLGTEGTSFGGGSVIGVHYESITNHELAHVLGLKHDYEGGVEDIGNGTYSAPGETKCLMDRNWNQFGSPERFALDIPMDVDNTEELDEVIKYINGQYLDDY